MVRTLKGSVQEGSEGLERCQEDIQRRSQRRSQRGS